MKQIPVHGSVNIQRTSLYNKKDWPKLLLLSNVSKNPNSPACQISLQNKTKQNNDSRKRKKKKKESNKNSIEHGITTKKILHI
jgi:hypothetical protein